jgi:competence protein ComGC
VKKDPEAVIKILLLLFIALLLMVMVVPELIRIRQALERAWPSHAQIEAVEERAQKEQR